jgi:hypothetical protein
MERNVVEERAHTKSAAYLPSGRHTTSNCLRQQGSLISPFPVSPSGGKPGRAGSPHAAGTLYASKKRWHTSMPRLPPQGGFQSAPLKPPLRIPPMGTTGAASRWWGLDLRDRSGRKRLRMAATSALTFTTFS